MRRWFHPRGLDALPRGNFLRQERPARRDALRPVSKGFLLRRGFYEPRSHRMPAKLLLPARSSIFQHFAGLPSGHIRTLLEIHVG